MKNLYGWEEFQSTNGLFPAAAKSDNPCMTNFWLRDQYIQLEPDSHPRTQAQTLRTRLWQALLELLPQETKTRQRDLALLSLLWPRRLVDDELADEILENVAPLVGRWGMCRYEGDEWDGNRRSLGQDREMEWTIGLPWLYLITGHEIWLEKALFVQAKFGYMPEGVIQGKSNGTHLIWAEAMLCAASEAANQRV